MPWLLKEGMIFFQKKLFFLVTGGIEEELIPGSHRFLWESQLRGELSQVFPLLSQPREMEAKHHLHLLHLHADKYFHYMRDTKLLAQNTTISQWSGLSSPKPLCQLPCRHPFGDKQVASWKVTKSDLPSNPSVKFTSKMKCENASTAARHLVCSDYCFSR